MGKNNLIFYRPLGEHQGSPIHIRLLTSPLLQVVVALASQGIPSLLGIPSFKIKTVANNWLPIALLEPLSSPFGMQEECYLEVFFLYPFEEL